jgi:hypothetical protein
LGGLTPLNDILLVVNTVNSGVIESAFCYGQAPLNSAGKRFTNITSTTISGSGIGANWTIETVPGTQTTFDGNSMLFTAPLDSYSNTQIYDKYLLFPQRNIIAGVIVPTVTTVNWTNTSDQIILWTNSNGQPVVWTNNFVST